MSKQMVENFFPASVEQIHRHSLLAHWYEDILFPDSVAQTCPEYTWPVSVGEKMDSMNIRQPFLLASAVWGIWIGMRGSGGLARRMSSSYWQHWSLALFYFGMMNVSAVFLHCLWKAPTMDYPTEYPIFWMIDTCMTGLSASHLMLASLQQLQQQVSFFPIRTSIPKMTVVIYSIGIMCVAWFLVDPAPSLIRASHPLELWYLVPPLLAGPPVLVWMYDRKTPKVLMEKMVFGTTVSKEEGFVPDQVSTGNVVFALSIVVISILGIALDRFWCQSMLNGLARDFFSANNLVFLGCDLSFWIICREIKDKESKKKTKNAPKKDC